MLQVSFICFVYFGLVLTSDLDPGSGAVTVGIRADRFIGP